MRFYNILLLTSTLTYSQINPKNIDIVRDQYGIPHIFAKTDAELAYGLAGQMLRMTSIQYRKHTSWQRNVIKTYWIKGAPAEFHYTVYWV
ncbi:MAG: hypothetical protein CM15mP126_7260 [Gammaproteobacteria bacterium]|nr:MAG: hypothetical protein CM15mP126_7260 [Gammaproteobacteria bacterium]